MEGKQLSTNGTALAQISKARRALEQAKTLDDVLDIRDKAEAVAVYLKSSRESLAAQNQAAEIKVRAERKAGELIAEMEHGKGNNQHTPRNEDGNTVLPSKTHQLSAVGLNKMAAHRLEQMAHCPDEEFEKLANAESMTVANKEITSSSIRIEGAKAKKAAARAEMAKDTPDTGQGVITGRWQDCISQVDDESVDLVFTDPPYFKEFVEDYADMAIESARILKPGGSLIAYCGHYSLPEILPSMSEHLNFYWCCACVHKHGNARMAGKGLFIGWKPLIWFIKGTKRLKNDMVSDTISGEKLEKGEHDWQQQVNEAAYYIERLTHPGGMVLDFYAGSGTTLIAANQMDRNAVGFEIDPQNARIARQRIAGT